MVGNELKLSGLSMKSTVIRISTEMVIDTLSNRSRICLGMGTSSTMRIAMTPIAKKMSLRCMSAFAPI